MFSFESFLDLPLIWYALIGTVIFLYVLLDGFDLGVGILFPFAPTDACRDRMMNSIAPFWDGNETWLVLGGGGLFAAFPLAYAILMPAFYIPIILMLLGLIFRGVAFEFRFKATGQSRRIWDYSFHIGSLVATFMQGMVLGTFVHGIAVEGRNFAGGPFDWLSAFSVMTGVALVTGYALLGATWTIMKTEGDTQRWARKCARYMMLCVVLFMGLVSLSHAADEQGHQGPVVQSAQLLLAAAHADPLGGFLRHALAGSWHRAGIPAFFSHPGHISHELHRHRDQHLALAGALQGDPVACGRGPGIPIPAAAGHGVPSALHPGLHGLLFLGVSGQGLPRT